MSNLLNNKGIAFLKLIRIENLIMIALTQILLRYFDEAFDDTCQYCDICDNPPTKSDATVDAQKLLSCIYRLKQSFGLNHVIDVLRGSAAEKITQFGHQKLSTYGIGKDKSSTYWKHLAWQLIHREYCFQDAEKFNVLKLTPKAVPVLRGEEHIALTVQVHVQDKEPRTKKKKTRGSTDTTTSPLFEKLRALRREIAQEESKPPFMVFSDATLRDLISVKPTTLNQMLDVSGVGQHKLTQYGQRFLEALG